MADLVKKVELKVVGDTADAQAKLDKITLKADKLRDLNPAIKVKIDTFEASAKLAVFREELKAATRKATATIDEKVGKRGLLGRLLFGAEGAAGSSSGGLLGATSGAQIPFVPGSGLPAIAAATSGVAALLPELAGLVAGLAAATAGVGAFGAVALPTFEKLTGDIAAVHNANQSFQESAKNVDTAIRSSSLDAADYNKALAAMPPNLRSATKLLGDQGVRWQDLTKRQQDNVTALANNKAALKLLLPSQKTALTALLSAKKAWDDMNPAQQKAATSLNQLSNAYQKIVTALQPDVFKVLNAGLKVANALLPALKPLAQAGATAIDGLLVKLAGFVNSSGFKAWLAQFGKLAGPSITAIGTGLGKVTIALGKLLTVMSAKDVVHALNIAFDAITITINAVTLAVKGLMKGWDFFEKSLIGQFGIIVTAAANAFGWIPGIGPALKAAQKQFDTWVANLNGGLGGIQAQATVTSTLLAQVANAALGAFSKAKASLLPGGTGGPQPLPKASGGWASGLIMTGERGRELLQVPAGSYVYNHAQTEAIMSGRRLAHATGRASGRGDGGGRIVLEVRAGNSAAYSNFLAGEIKKYVHAKGGGDVQVAFGRTA